MIRTRLLRFVIATVVVAATLAVAPLVDAANTGVDIAGFAFAPQTVTVHVGDTVTWSNSDARSHTATADGGSFDTGTIANGTSKTVTFSTAGAFGYHCSIHPQMTATVVVEAAALPPTDTATVSTPGSGGALLFLALVFAACVVVAGRRFSGREAPAETPPA